MRYIYFDETEFGKKNDFIGYGALACDDAINHNVISEALNNLKNDPDIYDVKTKYLDKTTLKLGLFHASKDSKNAHSHLCNSINEHLSGLFRADIFDKNKNRRKSEHLLSLASNLSSMKALNTRDNIVAIFERRSNLHIQDLEISFKSLYDDLIKSCYDFPLIPVFFPKIQFKIVDKTEPGVQCTDFLLWATQRKYSGSDDWYNRINKKHSFEFENDGEEWKGVNLELNYRFDDAKSHYELGDYSKEYDDNIDKELLANILFYVIRTITHFASNSLPPSITYQKDNLVYLAKNRFNPAVENYVHQIAQAYLKLFDMVPLIAKKTSKIEKEFLLSTKKYMGLTQHRNLIHGVRTSDYFSKVRRLNIKTNPVLFG